MESSSRENTCVVCFRNISIYAVGDCDHYDRICYICSTRLRVLCNKYDCPMCRKDIPKVIFSKHRQPYSALSRICYPVDYKYKIAFVDDEVRQNYDMLMEHACKVCPTKQVFPSFGHLKDHLRKEHQLFFCELCVENLKLFPHERRFYTRKELGFHRRVGDTDDTSHKGHPSCQYCEKRFMDVDDLFRHLRKDHFFCHFCDSDGKNFFYGDYKFLQDHFRDDHFLCEEGSCKEEKFTGAFRSQIDLKAHKASEHCKNMNKQQAKQARTLELEFTYRPRPNQPGDYLESSARRGGGRKGGPPKSTRAHRENDEEEYLEAEYAMLSLQAGAASTPYTHCQNEFPQLGDTLDGARSEGGKVSVSVAPVKKYSKIFNANSEEDFPVLSGVPLSSSSGASNVTSARVTFPSPQPSRTANSVLFKINNKDKGGAPGNISIQVSSKSKPVMTKDNFPSLPTRTEKFAVPVSATLAAAVTNAPTKTERNESVLSKSGNGSSAGLSKNGSGNSAALSKSGNNNSAALSKSGNNNSAETNGWKTVKGPNKQTFENDFPQLAGKPSSVQEKRVSSLTIPVGGSGWTKSANQKDKVSSKIEPPPSKEEEPSFLVSKGKNAKKSDKKNQNVQEAKPKSKESSEKKDIGKNREKVEIRSSPPTDNGIANETLPQKEVGTIREIVKDNKEGDKTKSAKFVGSEMNDEEFPPLVVQRKTPPGFSSKPNTNSNNPPPGFLPSTQNSLNLSNDVTALTLSAVTRQLANPDATSSAIDPNGLSSVPKLIRASYIEPSNFEDRNRSLIQKIKDLLDGDDEAFVNFKVLSGQFRQSMLQAKEYYENCIVIFGKEKFLKIFPELLVLLPDIGKEQELLNIYNQISKKDSQSYGAVPKSSVLSTQVLVCATCQQVLAAKDFQKHMFYHNEDSLFPPLAGCNNNNSSTTHITWLKK